MAKDAAACAGEDRWVVTMRKEYDFSKGTRGNHVGKRIRVVSKKRSRDRPRMVDETQPANSRDSKGPKVSNDTDREKRAVNPFEARPRN